MSFAYAPMPRDAYLMFRDLVLQFLHSAAFEGGGGSSERSA